MAGANALGIDVSQLDIAAFLASSRALFPVLGLLWLAALLLIRRPAWIVAGGIAGSAWVWGVTNYPLQRIYALTSTGDRLGNLGLCQVVAAGNSALRTWQVGQLHFEPFWALLVAILSGFDPARVLVIYPFFALVVPIAFALAVYWGLRPVLAPGDGAAWPAALAAFSALLLSSAPLDFTGIYRVPYAMSFLLKPNHALGLVLLPLVLRAFAGIQGWRSRLGVGLLLHLVGWAFVLHMVYLVVGLMAFAALSLLERKGEARRDLLDVVVVIGVNLIVVSPYLYMLFAGYPFLDRLPVMTIHPASPHLLETTTRVGPMFWLGAWGGVVLYRRGGRLGRLWAAQVVGAYVIWLGYLVLSFLQLARERDEIDYWIRFLLAACAAFGMWDLVGRAAHALGQPRSPATLAAAAMVLAMPWTIPYWWNPAQMDSYFTTSMLPMPESIVKPALFLRAATAPHAVMAGDRTFARYAATFGARRSLLSEALHFPKDYARRADVEAILVRSADGGAVRAAAGPYGVDTLIVTPDLLSRFPGITLADIEARQFLRRIYFMGEPGGEFVAIYHIEPRP